MTDKRIVLTTVGDRKEAEELAWALVERKLAACVNIVPITGVFKWKGELEQQQEYMLMIKTSAAAFERVQDAIKELNSYELPECLQISIEAGSDSYLNWIAESLK